MVISDGDFLPKWTKRILARYPVATHDPESRSLIKFKPIMFMWSLLGMLKAIICTRDTLFPNPRR